MLYLPTRVAFLRFLFLLLIFLFGPPCVTETMPHVFIGKLHVLWLWERLCDCILPDWIWVDVTCIISRPGLLNPTRSLLLSLFLNVELPAEDREVQTEGEPGSRTNWMKHPHPPYRPIALGMKETCYFIMLSNETWGLLQQLPSLTLIHALDVESRHVGRQVCPMVLIPTVIWVSGCQYSWGSSQLKIALRGVVSFYLRFLT